MGLDCTIRDQQSTDNNYQLYYTSSSTFLLAIANSIPELNLINKNKVLKSHGKFEVSAKLINERFMPYVFEQARLEWSQLKTKVDNLLKSNIENTMYAEVTSSVLSELYFINTQLFDIYNRIKGRDIIVSYNF